MKIYMMIPFDKGKTVKIKERNCPVFGGTLVSNYAKHFGEQNKYYVHLTSDKAWGMAGVKYMYYNDYLPICYYIALRPCDMVKKKVIKTKEVKT